MDGDGSRYLAGDDADVHGNRPATKPNARTKSKAGKDFKAWGNNFRYNDLNRAKQIQWLQQEVMNKQQKGVEVYRTK